MHIFIIVVLSFHSRGGSWDVMAEGYALILTVTG